MNYSWYAPDKTTLSSDQIHQTFAYGSLEDIKKLKNTVGEEKLRTLFLQSPKKVYTPALLYFIQKFILNIDIPFDEQKYLSTTPRNIR